MDKFDYEKSAQLALRSITKFGGDANLIKKGEVDVDITKPWLGKIDSEIIYPTQAVKIPLSKDDLSYLAKGTIIESMNKIFMEAVQLTVEPKVSDKVSLNGEIWTIKTIKPLKPYDIDVLWTLYVGK